MEGLTRFLVAPATSWDLCALPFAFPRAQHLAESSPNLPYSAGRIDQTESMTSGDGTETLQDPGVRFALLLNSAEIAGRRPGTLPVLP